MLGRLKKGGQHPPFFLPGPLLFGQTIRQAHQLNEGAPITKFVFAEMGLRQLGDGCVVEIFQGRISPQFLTKGGNCGSEASFALDP